MSNRSGQRKEPTDAANRTSEGEPLTPAVHGGVCAQQFGLSSVISWGLL